MEQLTFAMATKKHVVVSETAYVRKETLSKGDFEGYLAKRILLENGPVTTPPWKCFSKHVSVPRTLLARALLMKDRGSSSTHQFQKPSGLRLPSAVALSLEILL